MPSYSAVICHVKLLISHLQQYTREEKTAIILFISPKQMRKNSSWYAVLLDLALRGCISAVCVDKVHSTVQDFESFRPELKTAMIMINTIVAVARRANKGTNFYVPILVMLATFTMSDQQSFNDLICH